MCPAGDAVRRHSSAEERSAQSRFKAAQFARTSFRSFTPFAQIILKPLARDCPVRSSFGWNEKGKPPVRGGRKATGLV